MLGIWLLQTYHLPIKNTEQQRHNWNKLKKWMSTFSQKTIDCHKLLLQNNPSCAATHPRAEEDAHLLFATNELVGHDIMRLDVVEMFEIWDFICFYDQTNWFYDIY